METTGILTIAVHKEIIGVILELYIAIQGLKRRDEGRLGTGNKPQYRRVYTNRTLNPKP